MRLHVRTVHTFSIIAYMYTYPGSTNRLIFHKRLFKVFLDSYLRIDLFVIHVYFATVSLLNVIVPHWSIYNITP